MGGFFLVIIGLFFIWTATFALPDLDGFEARRIASSTKIYDSTGEVVLFDVHRDARRTVVASDQISPYIKNAAIAIEDERFYQHRGIDLRAIARAIMVNVRGTGISQGGSTITQQVMKNTLLTSDRKITRKIKEWVLSVRIERKMTKDEILTQYLNVVPFGGVMYGVEEASRSFFGKSASEVTLAEAAYLAAIPNAPTFFSPYGNNRDRLENRKNLVLNNMRKLGFITEEEFEVARNEEVAFLPRSNNFGRALHFVEYVRAQVEAKYGRDAIENDGLRIITSLNADLQEFAEQVVQENAIQNTEQWSATNQGAIVIDPHTGHILAMVGSRGYSDREIDGSFNVTLAERQPGSSFKPFIYAAAFDKGYTPETVLFDVRTQFSTSCSPSAITNNTLPCYAPQNYDNEYNGPISLRAALAESRNIPAVKLLYLVGVREAVNFARNLGITSLGNPDRYGLTLVLGGGEVSLLEMSSAYGVFATGGVYNAPVSILRIEDKEGNILEEHQGRPERVLNAQAAALLNSVLKDNEARLPLFGTINNFLFFGEGRDVAGKTGTTNNNRDAWLIGYSPDVVVGVWTGNNDNTPMRRGSAISGPTFRAIMTEALKSTSNFRFEEPAPIDLGSLKPIMRGEWRGGETVTIDTISGKLATQYTPEEARAEVALINPNSILHWVDRNNPLGPAPQNPASDNQYNHWQFAVQAWLQQNWQNLNLVTEIPTEYSTVHSPETMPTFSIISPTSGQSFNANQNITVQLSIQNTYPMRRVQYFVNDFFVGSRNEAPFQSFTFSLADVPQTQETNTLRVVIQDEVFNSVTQEITINKN
ncbi:MAG: PBP1A family penicillin-binding protein [Candidatus Pacebacteria bacterium]|nr:PBP1A family penicillin-binding protein [Candidatus Paceibacterota bacterium]